MRVLPKLFILGAIFFAFCASAWGLPYNGEVTVGSAVAAPGEQAAIPVSLSNNDIGIASLTVPIKFSSSAIEVDSISFAGTLLKAGMNPLVDIDNDARFVRFTYYPGSQEITEAEGLLATIFFSVGVTAPDQTVSIDSVYDLEIHGEYQLWTRIEFADTSGLSLFFPTFSSGEVEIHDPLDVDYDYFNLPKQLSLDQNYPNPFNPSTTLSFSIPERAHVSLKVYNILGQEVETLVDETRNAGEYRVAWQASDKASGIYFYRLSYQDKVLTKKMVLLK